jgi:hypothetical protein
MESHNVCLRLCTYEFNSFGSLTAPYSYLPVILTVYNLPPKMCMKSEFMFLSTVRPVPNSLGWNIDVCLWSLITELNLLWSSRTLIDDVLSKQNFQMKTTLIWIVNDFPVYGMISNTIPLCWLLHHGLHH